MNDVEEDQINGLTSKSSRGWPATNSKLQVLGLSSSFFFASCHSFTLNYQPGLRPTPSVLEKTNLGGDLTPPPHVQIHCPRWCQIPT